MCLSMGFVISRDKPPELVSDINGNCRETPTETTRKFFLNHSQPSMDWMLPVAPVPLLPSLFGDSDGEMIIASLDILPPWSEASSNISLRRAGGAIVEELGNSRKW